MVTMVDVAREAGVSVKTVSRVVNDEPHVQETLRVRVRSAIHALGYVPSASARSLRSNRSYTIALISHGDISNYVNTVQFGATLACQAAGYQSRVVLTNTAERSCAREFDRVLDRAFPADPPEGAILVAPLCGDPIVEAALQARGIHIGRIGPQASHVDTKAGTITVAVDEAGAAERMVGRLLDLGHRRIGFVRGREDQAATEARFVGYARALRRAGIAIDHDLVAPGDFEFASGRAAGGKLLSLAHPPTAIFAANDDMAAGVIAEATARDIAVPARLSVVGFDDSEIAEKMQPALTTVRQPILDYGRVAVERLIGAITKADGQDMDAFLDYELIERASHAPAPGLDRSPVPGPAPD